jgi:hypothetical protein
VTGFDHINEAKLLFPPDPMAVLHAIAGGAEHFIRGQHPT